MKYTKAIFGLLAAAAITAAGCGGGNDDSAVSDAPAPLAAPAGSSVAVKVGESALGDILVGPNGMTLYAFTNDSRAISTCYDACASAWPPVIVDSSWAVSPTLDSGVFSTVVRDDGSMQLVAGKFPLYEFAGDAVPGDINGQGSGDVWFVVDTDAKLVTAKASGRTPTPTTAPKGAPAPAPAPTPAAAASVKLADSPLGKIMVDTEGRTLYGFTKDTSGTPTCVDACAKAWPASSVSGQAVPGAGVSAPVRTVTSPAGGTMIVAGKWPLYRFAGDSGPGDTNGQGSAGVWFVVAADGTLIKN